MSATGSDLAYLCRALKAPALLEATSRLGERARDEGWSHEEYLAACLEREVTVRAGHGGEARIKAARFPARKGLEGFDFEHQRSVRRDVIAHLGELDFVAAKENVVFLGPPGVGKSHCETDDPALSRANAQTGVGSGGHDPNVALASRGVRRA